MTIKIQGPTPHAGFASTYVATDEHGDVVAFARRTSVGGEYGYVVQTPEGTVGGDDPKLFTLTDAKAHMQETEADGGQPDAPAVEGPEEEAQELQSLAWMVPGHVRFSMTHLFPVANPEASGAADRAADHALCGVEKRDRRSVEEYAAEGKAPCRRCLKKAGLSVPEPSAHDPQRDMYVIEGTDLREEKDRMARELRSAWRSVGITAPVEFFGDVALKTTSRMRNLGGNYTSHGRGAGPNGLITMRRGDWEGADYLRFVLLHEMCHAAGIRTPDKAKRAQGHDDAFNRLMVKAAAAEFDLDEEETLARMEELHCNTYAADEACGAQLIARGLDFPMSRKWWRRTERAQAEYARLRKLRWERRFGGGRS